MEKPSASRRRGPTTDRNSALGRKLGFESSRTDEPSELELAIDLRSVQFEGLENREEIQSVA